jgi:thiosulfate/3-mercaptopyruvate sulfurtransferase
LKANLPKVKVLDCSWYLPAVNRQAKQEYLAGHIPGASFFDVDAVSDNSSGLPHMLPSPAVFERAVSDLGITNDDTVVAYDGAGVFSSPRLWWTFRVFGHDSVAVLDGGFPAWKDAGLPVESGDQPISQRANFRAQLRRELVSNLEEVEGTNDQLVDARPAARFLGQAPEPRPGLRSGSVLGSRNMPQASFLREGKFVLPPQQLRALFGEARVDPLKPMIALCGSGMTACTVALGAAVLGNEDVRVYDGSWAEYGKITYTPRRPSKAS